MPVIFHHALIFPIGSPWTPWYARAGRHIRIRERKDYVRWVYAFRGSDNESLLALNNTESLTVPLKSYFLRTESSTVSNSNLSTCTGLLALRCRHALTHDMWIQHMTDCILAFTCSVFTLFNGFYTIFTGKLKRPLKRSASLEASPSRPTRSRVSIPNKAADDWSDYGPPKRRKAGAKH